MVLTGRGRRNNILLVGLENIIFLFDGRDGGWGKGGNYGIRVISDNSFMYRLEEDSTNNPLANTP